MFQAPYDVDVNNMIIVTIAGFIPLLFMMIIFHAVMRRKDRKSSAKVAPQHIAGVYVFCFVLICLFFLTGIPNILHFSFDPKINTVPLYTFQTTFNLYMLNMLLFLPVGFLLPMLWKKFGNVFRTLLCGFLFSLFIEILQVFNARITDVDDLMMNTAGTLIGFLIYYMAKGISPHISAASINRANHWKQELFVCFLFAWLSMFFIQPFISNWIWDLILAH